jgi:hypothetical protein
LPPSRVSFPIFVPSWQRAPWRSWPVHRRASVPVHDSRDRQISALVVVALSELHILMAPPSTHTRTFIDSKLLFHTFA